MNALERKLERGQREWDGYRWELYAIWHQWAKRYTESRQEPTEITAKINDLKQQVAARAQQLNTLKGERDAAEQAIRNTVEQQFAELEFVSSPAGPFWLATDPALLISGPGLVLSQRHGQDGRYSKQNDYTAALPARNSAALSWIFRTGRKG